MSADLRHTVEAPPPARGHVIGVVPEDVGGKSVREVLGRDMGDCNRLAPGSAASVNWWEATVADERELRRLQHDLADRARIFSRCGAVEHYLGDGELAFDRLPLGFEIDSASQALAFRVDCARGCMSLDQSPERAARLDRIPRGTVIASRRRRRGRAGDGGGNEGDNIGTVALVPRRIIGRACGDAIGKNQRR